MEALPPNDSSSDARTEQMPATPPATTEQVQAVNGDEGTVAFSGLKNFLEHAKNKLARVKEKAGTAILNIAEEALDARSEIAKSVAEGLDRPVTSTFFQKRSMLRAAKRRDKKIQAVVERDVLHRTTDKSGYKRNIKGAATDAPQEKADDREKFRDGMYLDSGITGNRSRNRTVRHDERQAKTIDKIDNKRARMENGDDIAGKTLKLVAKVGVKMGGKPHEREDPDEALARPKPAKPKPRAELIADIKFKELLKKNLAELNAMPEDLRTDRIEELGAEARSYAREFLNKQNNVLQNRTHGNSAEERARKYARDSEQPKIDPAILYRLLSPEQRESFAEMEKLQLESLLEEAESERAGMSESQWKMKQIDLKRSAFNAAIVELGVEDLVAEKLGKTAKVTTK
ncbi:hypothetical protein HZB74_03540 [Candidatus Saccharibacteria bacterium]|nr:hypothetical protein [Candidatus Saccharibacteria bacterium]